MNKNTTEYNINFQPRYTFMEAIEKMSALYNEENDNLYHRYYIIICEDDVKDFLAKDKNIERYVGLTVAPHRTPDGTASDLIRAVIGYNPLEDMPEFFTLKTTPLTLEDIAKKWTAPIAVPDLLRYMDFLRRDR